MKYKKTGVMRLLDQQKIGYRAISYDISDGKIDGKSVADKISVIEDRVYKTLVTQSKTKRVYVFLLPVNKELNLKKAAAVVSEKSLELVPVSSILSLTGYIKGGCSPIGMKKAYITYYDVAMDSLDSVVISAGKIGFQVALSVKDLLSFVAMQRADITD